MEIADLVEAFKSDRTSASRIVHIEVMPARRARYADPAKPVLPLLTEKLAGSGIERLYAHQAKAIDLIRAGSHTVIATGTASGKSLCYNVPALEAILGKRPASALYLFPTKALAQDQLRAIRAMTLKGVFSAAYDGDTPDSERSWIRKGANLVVSNPDMLHYGILPNHQRWAPFFKKLRYVVLDELHTLRGIFGSHVANLMRRLRRVAAHYGSSPVFVASSATIGEPEVLGRQITGLDMELVDKDGSPCGRRYFLLWDPPLAEPELGIRASSHIEAAGLLAELVEAGLTTIAFAKSRRGAEVVAQAARRKVADAGLGELASKITSYRGGYLASERREIEKQLFKGKIAGIAATNALELGIDIGGLDACILDAFPGTIASMRQQAGRAGRRLGDSIAILVGSEDQLDRWYLAHPRELFDRRPEPAVAAPDNRYVLAGHLGCAASEIPLAPDESGLFGDTAEELAAELVAAGHLKVRGGKLWWARSAPPAQEVGLRSGSAHPYQIVETGGRLVGTEDEGRAFSTLHPGAVYLHAGTAYEVEELDLDERIAYVSEFDGGHYTMARSDTDIDLLSVDEELPLGEAVLGLGDVQVSETVTGYKILRAGTREVIGYENLEMPSQSLETRAFWLAVGDDLLGRLDVGPERVPGTMHAIEHAGIGVLPLFLICDRWDIGGVSLSAHPGTGVATSFIYDGYPGGAGIADAAYRRGRDHLAATLEAIAECPCDAGCPSCIQSPKCGNWNEPLDKAGAIAALDALVGPAAPAKPARPAGGETGGEAGGSAKPKPRTAGAAGKRKTKGAGSG